MSVSNLDIIDQTIRLNNPCAFSDRTLSRISATITDIQRFKGILFGSVELGTKTLFTISILFRNQKNYSEFVKTIKPCSDIQYNLMGSKREPGPPSKKKVVFDISYLKSGAEESKDALKALFDSVDGGSRSLAATLIAHCKSVVSPNVSPLSATALLSGAPSNTIASNPIGNTAVAPNNDPTNDTRTIPDRDNTNRGTATDDVPTYAPKPLPNGIINGLTAITLDREIQTTGNEPSGVITALQDAQTNTATTVDMPAQTNTATTVDTPAQTNTATTVDTPAQTNANTTPIQRLNRYNQYTDALEGFHRIMGTISPPRPYRNGAFIIGLIIVCAVCIIYAIEVLSLNSTAARILQGITALAGFSVVIHIFNRNYVLTKKIPIDDFAYSSSTLSKMLQQPSQP